MYIASIDNNNGCQAQELNPDPLWTCMLFTYFNNRICACVLSFGYWINSIGNINVVFYV
jgi:hypothetical protein